MSEDRDSRSRDIPNIPGSYYERIIEARHLMEHERWDEAAIIQERIIDRLLRLPERRRQPGSDQALFLMATSADLHLVRIEQGDFDAARALCRQLETWDAKNSTLWRRRFYRTYTREGKIDEGLDGLRQLTESDPDDWGNWLTRAHETIAAGRVDGVEALLEQALSLARADADDNDLALVYFGFYRLYVEEKRWDEACDAWDTAVALDVGLIEIQEELLRTLIQAGEIDLALRHIDDESLSLPVADYYRALIAHQRGDVVRARYLWRQVADTDKKESPDALLARALAKCWLDKPLEALSELLSDVRSSKSLSGRAALTLGLAWAMQGNAEATHTNLATAARQSGDRDGKLSSLDWYEFEHLVEEGDLKQEIKRYFDLSA